MRGCLMALAIAVAAASAGTPAMAQGENLGYRLTALEEQVRQLVGQIQELQHQLRQIEARGGGGGMDRSQSAFNAPQQRPQGLFQGNNATPPSGQPLPGSEPPPPSQDLGSTSSFQSYDLQSYGNAQGQGAANAQGQGAEPEQAPQERQAQPGQGGGNEMVELDGEEDAKPRERAPGPKVLGQVSTDAINGGMPGP